MPVVWSGTATRRSPPRSTASAEAFVVQRHDPYGAAGPVRLAITAFSRPRHPLVRLAITAFSGPRHPLVRLAGPMARRQQERATQGYLDALAAHVRDVLA
jgi:uncharacterized protein (UPF0548 family)